MLFDKPLLNYAETSKQPTSIDLAMIDHVLEEANRAIDEGKVGVAALLLWRDEILAIGHNIFVETHDMTAHGEIAALRAATDKLYHLTPEEKAEITMYVSLEPCLMCFSAISFVGIKRLVFSALCEDGKAEVWTAKGISCGELNPYLTNGSIEIIEGVRREQGRAVLARMGKLAG